MTRKPRLHFPGAVYHVILRGNAGTQVFFTKQDRFRLYLFLQECVERFHCRIHGFCCMKNHIHLIVQVEDVPLSLAMQNVSLRYTKWINFSQNRTGHVFQGRYKALLVDADSYLLELVRYVHLNPVRAGIVKSPELYPWSGHHCYLGDEALPWLTTNFVLSQFGSNDLARNAYREFVNAGVEEKRRGDFYSGTCEGRILGDDQFIDTAFKSAQERHTIQWKLTEIVAAVCSSCGIDEEQLKHSGKTRPFTKARALAAALVHESPHLLLSDLALFLNRDVSALSKAAQRALCDGNLTDELARVREILEQKSKCRT